MGSITCFLPCRSGSERVKNKNTKPFAGIKDGLLSIKLDQLERCPLIEKIVLSTNDHTILEYASKYRSDKLVIDVRAGELCQSSTSTDDLIKYIPKVIDDDHILWTHVTSPLFDELEYARVIDDYFTSLLNGYDSLMTVKKIQSFIWNDSKPINYDRSNEKWPRTQTIKPLYEINSGAFISSRENYLKYEDRVGDKPYLFVQDDIVSADIDWPEDFKYVEMLYERKRSFTDVFK